MLTICAIGKFSWKYWKEEFGNYLNLKSTTDYFESMNNVVNADIEGGVAGALVGGYIGATGGTVVGPAGAVIGAVSGFLGGAYTGALGSSAVRGAIELWDNIFD